jgi:NAD(P)-dependent dehydrogenase (short-subunit alcohol dehydrogenase family)
MGRARDIAEAACFLASDASDFINGVALPVDGGSSAVTLGSFGTLAQEATQQFLEG